MAKTLPHTLLKLIPATCAALVLAASAAFGQTPAGAPGGSPSFEVISIKPISPDTSKGVVFLGLLNTPDGANAPAIALPILLRSAYGGYMKFPTDDRVVGLPAWAKTQIYAISAKMSEAEIAGFQKLSKDDQEQQRELMLQSMLADRFHLKAHLEQKQVPVYELVIAKGGPRLTDAAARPANSVVLKGADGQPIHGPMLRMAGIGKVTAQNFDMERLANFLAQPPVGLGRPVVNKTGLTSTYDFTLNWTPDSGIGPAPNAPAVDASGPSIFTALQEQLGLRLQPTNSNVDIIVVDHIERPSEN